MKKTEDIKENTKKKSKKKIVLIVVAAVIAAIILACVIYLSDYYHADETALGIANGEIAIDGVTVVKEDDMLVFVPDDYEVGLVFYPGGKVQYESYAPLMAQLAEEGILCVLPHMTGNLAFLESNAADKALEKYPEIEEWYISGHSLGGIAASGYVSKKSEKYEGIIFLASYPSSDLSGTDLRALTVRGSQDMIVTSEDYEESAGYLPFESTEAVIEGGCHAYFGNYGEQDGDGTATITREEQQNQTVDTIVEFVNE